MKLHRIDHVGIIVNDLPVAKAFFLELGLEVQREGEWLDQIVGLDGVKTGYVFLRMPEGQAKLELIKYYTPPHENGIQQSLANTLGIRHIALIVEDIEAIVAKLKAKGKEIFGEIQNHEESFKYATFVGQKGLSWNWRSQSNTLSVLFINLSISLICADDDNKKIIVEGEVSGDGAMDGENTDFWNQVFSIC